MAVREVKIELVAGERQALNNRDSDNTRGQSLAIFPCAADLYLGGDTITSSGPKLPAGASFSIDVERGETLYAVSTVDTTVDLLLQGA